jgi:Mrp family chromosome partitioning ATPase
MDLMEMMKSITVHGRLHEAADASLSSVAFQPSPDTDAFPLVPSEVRSLSATYLLSHRIVAFRPKHRITRVYDMLRNQVANLHPHQETIVVAVTAPSPGCGTSVTAINLALSFARISAGRVLLFDTDRSSPATPDLLGLSITSPPSKDNALNGHVLARVEDVDLDLLWLAKQRHRSGHPDRLASEIDRVHQALKPAVIIVDLAPMLSCDEAVPVLKSADIAVLVVANAQTTRSEYEACRSFFRPEQTVQVLLNKAGRHGL